MTQKNAYEDGNKQYNEKKISKGCFVNKAKTNVDSRSGRGSCKNLVRKR